MIEFAKFAKSYATPRDVEKAYDLYLNGARLWNIFNKTVVAKPVNKLKFKREVKPLTEGKTKSNVKHYPNGVPPKKGPPPSPGVIKNTKNASNS